MNGKNLLGKRFGRLIVTQDVGRNKRREKLWLCKCDCGNTKVTITSRLIKRGNIKLWLL